jgi:FG-GAP-like repeat
MKRLAPAAIAVMLVLGGAASAAPVPAPSFAPTKSSALGRGAEGITFADLNGDGRPDIATPHYDAATVSVLLNRGDGRFGARATYRTAAGPWELELADLNGDGKPEAVAPTRTGIWVLLNRGDGSFEPRRDYATAKDPVLAIHDLNSDGKLDLVAAVWPNAVSVLINTGDGSFQPRRDYSTGAKPLYVDIADLTGDGHPDLLTSSGAENTLSVLVNRGDGTFAANQDYPIGKGSFSIGVEIADLNADSKPDLVTANVDVKPDQPDSCSLSVLLNDGAGRFSARHDLAPVRGESGADLSAVAIRDVDGDSDPDLATTRARTGFPARPSPSSSTTGTAGSVPRTPTRSEEEASLRTCSTSPT